MSSLNVEAEAQMETELADELNNSLKTGFPLSSDYESVEVLLISWKDADDPEIAQEVENLRFFFENTWNFPATPVTIPPIRSQGALQSTLSQFIFNYKESKASLLIVYYAGHGDANPQEMKAIWAQYVLQNFWF